MPSIKPGEVGVGTSAIIVHNRHLLVGRRGQGCGHGKGLWSFPGGHIDFGETSFAEQISREVYEEVGIPILAKPDPAFIRNEIKKDCGLHYITFYMACALRDGFDVDLAKPITHKEREAFKGDEWIWLTFHQLSVMLHSEPNDEIYSIQKQWLPLGQIRENFVRLGLGDENG